MLSEPLFDRTPSDLPRTSPGHRADLPKVETFPSLAQLQAVVEKLKPEMERRGHQQIEILYDQELQIAGFVCIHSTTRGPALGGLRLREYDSPLDAGQDVLNLAEGMSLKALGADLPLGGGKAVLIKPQDIKDEAKYFRRVGELLREACPDGRYITAEDMGTSVERLGHVSETYPYTVGLKGGAEDPSPATAMGVFLSIEAIIQKLDPQSSGNLSLKGKTVALQGLGHVGMSLAEKLHEAGATLLVADIDSSLTEEAKRRFGAEILDSDQVLFAKCDILAPCGPGGVVNRDNVQNIRARAIVGSANNIIRDEDEEVHRDLHRKGRLYAPDFIVNAGGLCQVPLDIKDDLLEQLLRAKWTQVENINDIGPIQRITAIPERLIEAINEAEQQDSTQPPSLLILNKAKKELLNHREQ